MKPVILFLSLFCVSIAFGQQQLTMPDTHSLLTTSEIDSMFGCKLNDAASVLHGSYCVRKNDETKQEVILKIEDLHTRSAAATMIKANYKRRSKKIAAGEKVEALFTTFDTVPSAGKQAHFLTGEGNDIAGHTLTRFQFAVGNYLVTMDTKGIQIGVVKSKLKDIYEQIKGRSQQDK